MEVKENYNNFNADNIQQQEQEKINLNMKETIFKLIKQAEFDEDYELISIVRIALTELNKTMPDLTSDIIKTYDETTWVYEEMELWRYENN